MRSCAGEGSWLAAVGRQGEREAARACKHSMAEFADLAHGRAARLEFCGQPVAVDLIGSSGGLCRADPAELLVQPAAHGADAAASKDKRAGVLQRDRPPTHGMF